MREAMFGTGIAGNRVRVSCSHKLLIELLQPSVFTFKSKKRFFTFSRSGEFGKGKTRKLYLFNSQKFETSLKSEGK